MMKKYIALSVVASAAIIGFVGCGDDSDDSCNTSSPSSVSSVASSVAKMSFSSVSVPLTDEQKRVYNASKSVAVDGKSYPIDYNTLFRTGDKNGNETFGLIKDIAGVEAVKNPLDGSNYMCSGTAKDGSSGPDHTTLLNTEFGLFTVTHFECAVGGAYITKLDQDKTSGKLKPIDGSMKWVDFSSVKGTGTGCAGVATSWRSHLGSEEYEIDMKLVNNTTCSSTDEYDNAKLNAFRAYLKGAHPNGYDYGYITEIKVTSANGNTKATKHYSMGRLAFELSYVMPDNKTAYLTDDGTNVGFFMYISDKEKELTSGTLYAAKLTQLDSKNGGTFDISWISLGHSSDEEVAKMIASKLTFGDIFEEEKEKDANSTVGSGRGNCSTGFTSINAGHSGGKHEYLKVKAGMEKAASRLETRRYASMLGATTELNKEEGVTFAPEYSKLYVAMSRIEYGMEDNKKGGKANTQYDKGGHNDIKVEYNKCGGVYGMDVAGNIKDKGGNAINSNYVVKNMAPEVWGEMKTYTDSNLSSNSCNIDKIATPDNITYLPDYDTLIIGEDGDYHQNDAIWSYNIKTKSLTRIFTTPYGSETTSPFWYPNINGFGYLTGVIQHPYGETDSDKAPNSSAKNSFVGYFGPFPALNK